MSDAVMETFRTGPLDVEIFPPVSVNDEEGEDSKFWRVSPVGSKDKMSTVSENVSVISAISSASEKLSSCGAVVSGVKTATCRALLRGTPSATFPAGSVTIPSEMLTNVVLGDVAISETALISFSSSIVNTS